MGLKASYQLARGDRSTHSSNFFGQQALEAMGLDPQKSLGRTLGDLRPKFHSLARETHPEIFSKSFYALAQREELLGNDGRAALLYRALQRWQPQSPLGQQATERLNLIQGGGNLTQKIERAYGKLIPAFGDPANLLGMLAAVRVYRGVSSGLMLMAGKRSLQTRALATLGGFSLEVPAFSLTHRGVQQWQGKSLSWDAKTLAKEMTHTARNLGALKAFGLLGAHAVAPLGSGGVMPKLVPQVSMLTGVMGAQGLEVALHPQNNNGLESFVVDSLTLYLHFNLAGKVLGPLLPSPRSLSPKKGPSKLLPNGAAAFANPGLAVFASATAGKAAVRPFPGFFSQQHSSPSSHPPARPSSVPPSPDSKIPPARDLSSGFRLKGEGLLSESIKPSLSEVENSISNLWRMEALPENWAQKFLQDANKLRQETQAIASILAQRNPVSLELITLTEMQSELIQMELTIRRVSNGTVKLEPGDAKEFLNSFAKIPNRLVNFIDGTGNILGVKDILIQSRDSLNTMVTMGRLPPGPLLGKDLSSEYAGKAEELGVNFWTFSLQEDPLWFNKTSRHLKELQELLDGTQRVMIQQRTHSLLVDEVAALQKEVGEIQGIFHNLSEVTHVGKPGQLFDHVLQTLYHVPTSYAGFIMETRMPDLRNSRVKAKEVLEILEENILF